MGSVFDKKVGSFIDRAGLIHLGFHDEKESEIAYALHKAYWKLGYATEIARALIEWGFNHLPVPILVAVVHPQNQASCQVLERA